jgi:hypothetical protein
MIGQLADVILAPGFQCGAETPGEWKILWSTDLVFQYLRGHS